MKLKASIAITAATLALSATAGWGAGGDTLKTVLERGKLNCTGHNGSYLGMTELDDQGNWKGVDIDLCRSLATAIFGTDKDHLDIIPLSWAQRWPAIQSGDVDVIIKATGWTFGRDTEVGLQFSNPYMLTPIQYLTRTDLGAKSAADLDGGTLCVQAGTTFERYAVGHAAAKGYKLTTVPFEKTEEARASFLSGRCDAFIDSDLQLAVLKNTQTPNPDDYAIIPDTLAAEPLSIAVRQDDDDWLDIQNWLLSALLLAEQSGVTSQNVDEMKANPPTPEVSKLLGATPGMGTPLGLKDDWAYNVIKQHGNYAEIWDRNIGKDSPYKLERGINALVQDGGVQYPIILD